MRTMRVIPCLDVKHGRVVKGVRFQGLRDAGDPVERAAAYEAQGARCAVRRYTGMSIATSGNMHTRGTMRELCNTVPMLLHRGCDVMELLMRSRWRPCRS